MADKLYYETSAANNLDALDVLEDPSVALPAHVKANYLYKETLSRDIKIGTMPINPPMDVKLNPQTTDDQVENINFVKVPAGYHDGSGKIYVGTLEEYTPGNAKPEDVAYNKVFWNNGKRLVGSLSIDQNDQNATATEDDIIEGETAWVNKKKLTGTIPKLPRKDKTLLCGESYTFPYGLSVGTTVISAASIDSQTPGDASSSDLMFGKTAWVNGKKIVGELDITEEIHTHLADTDALQKHVLAGKKFYSSEYDVVMSGRMPDHSGEPLRTIEIGKEFAIPEGYYSGFTKLKTKNLEDATVADARPEHIMETRTAWVKGEKITGTMPVIPSVIRELEPGTEFNIPLGFHSGTGKIITKSVQAQTPGTAQAIEIVSGRTAWVNGERLIGTMPDNGALNVEINPGDTFYIPNGYHTGAGSVFTKPLSDNTPGTASSNDILEGKTAWIDGENVTGTIPVNDPKDVVLNAGEYYDIPIGHHPGLSTITAATLDIQTDGTATEKDIFKSKVAWVKGKKIVGTMELIGDATAADVIAGKDFYSDDPRVKQTGKLRLSGTATEDDVVEGSTFYSDNPRYKMHGKLKFAGTALPSQVLEGSTFYNNNPKSVQYGAMINRGKIAKTIEAGERFTIPEGYHDGTGIITANNLGVQTPGTANADDIVNGASAWVNGEKITGTLTLDATVTPEKVVEGCTFYSNNPKQKLVGTMLSIHTKLIGVDCGQEYVILPGYYDGTSKVIGNSLESQTRANAESFDLLEGKTMWVKGEKITGTMVNNYGWSAFDVTAGETVTIPQGYHNGTGTITAKNLQMQTDGTAIDSDILDTKTAWINGEKVTGTMPNNANWSKEDVVAGTTITIPIGFHDGTGTVKAKDLASQTVADATANDILAPKTAWVNGTNITGTIETQPVKMVRITAGNDIKLPAGYYPEGITIYSLFNDRLDLTGTDASMDATQKTLSPGTEGRIENGILIVPGDSVT